MPDNTIHMMPECPNVEENDRTKEINEIEKINMILNLMNHEQLHSLYLVALYML